MKYRRLGSSDITVSTIALGCWAFADETMWGRQSKDDTMATVRTALDAGINFFDTAESYGNGRSEELLGDALKGRRNEAVIATKVSRGQLRREEVVAACDDSLSRLDVETIDLYQIHWPSHTTPLEETLGAMEELKQAGKIRTIGVSNFMDHDLVDAVALTRVDVNQMCYSLLWRALEYHCQPHCAAHDVSIICYSPLLQGLLSGKFRSPEKMPEARRRSRLFSGERVMAQHGEGGAEQQTFEALDRIRDICQQAGAAMGPAAIAWLLSREAVGSVIAGARTADQVRENAAASDLNLSSEVLEQLTKTTEPLKERFGAYTDLWRGPSDERMR